MMIDTNLLICWGAIHRKVAKGQTIFYEGDKAHFYYQLVSGRIKMVNCNEEGKEFIQWLFSAGESFGEPPLFDDGEYPASAVAEEDSVIIRLNKESLMQLLQENTTLLSKFTRVFATRLRLKAILSKEISCYGPEHRIIALIKQVKKKDRVPDHTKYKLDLTRQQIADMTGLRVETVIRAIRNLYEKGHLLVERGKVYC